MSSLGLLLFVLPLLCVLACAHAAVHQMKVGYVAPIKERLYREGRLKQYVKLKETAKASMPSILATQSQNVVDFEDMAYFAMITLGTPGQPFKAYLDTGSATLWMPDSSCSNGTSEECGDYCAIVPADTCRLFCVEKCCQKSLRVRAQGGGCNTKSRYDSSKSSSYVKNGEGFSLTYQTGTVTGFLGQDTFCVPGTTLCVKNQVFGQASKIGGGFVTQPIDGILGLAFPTLAYNHIKPPVFNAINQGLLDQPMFTVYFGQSGPTVKAKGGVVTYGGLDTVNCDSSVQYVPLTSATYFQFAMNGVSSGSYKLNNAKGWNTVSMTSATYIGGPTAVVQKLAQQVGATFNDDYQSYFIDCDARSPDISFTIGGNVYSVTPSNYIMSVGPGPCMFAFFGMQSGGFMPSWLLGPPLIREYCQVYDVGHERLGFAKVLTH